MTMRCGPGRTTIRPIHGGHIVLVAIADVAHYVTPGSALDKEALKRGNSAYFPDRVVPMLPEELSADLCSLKEGVDRPCLAVRMVFDAHGHKRGHAFLRGVMRSAARLTYARRRRAFDGKPDADMTATVQEDPGRSLGGLQDARHRARKARSAGPRPAGTAHRCWAPTARSPPSPIANGWNP